MCTKFDRPGMLWCTKTCTYVQNVRKQSCNGVQIRAQNLREQGCNGEQSGVQSLRDQGCNVLQTYLQILRCTERCTMFERTGMK